MKNRLVMLLTFLFIVTLGPYAQTQQKDVKGWRDAKWGSNEAQLLALFKDEAIRLNEIHEYDKWYAAIAIPNYEISNFKFTVHFLMDNKSKTLQQVNIIATKETLDSIYTAFPSLEQALTEKYGPPSFRNDKEEENKNIVWNFPSTIIELSLLDLKSADVKNLVITYHPPTTDKNKL
jgi:hypothetical protein